MEGTKRFALGWIVGVASVLVALFLIVLIVAYSGGYNIAASEDHTPFVRWVFDTTMRNAVEGRAADLEVPAFTEDMVAMGASEYQAMCEHCHAGPGAERADWAEGMLPQPPHLTEAAAEWEPNEVFWLVKHGVKMSAMPAFGEDHDDRTIWSLAAFVSELPGMTAETYESYGRGGHGDDNHRH